jgi:hypothetical protein
VDLFDRPSWLAIRDAVRYSDVSQQVIVQIRERVPLVRPVNPARDDSQDAANCASRASLNERAADMVLVALQVSHCAEAGKGGDIL